jgi:hypothetical protein
MGSCEIKHVEALFENLSGNSAMRFARVCLDINIRRQKWGRRKYERSKDLGASTAFDGLSLRFALEYDTSPKHDNSSRRSLRANEDLHELDTAIGGGKAHASSSPHTCCLKAGEGVEKEVKPGGFIEPNTVWRKRGSGDEPIV